MSEGAFNNEIAKSVFDFIVDNMDKGYFTIEKIGQRGYEDFNAQLIGAYLGSCGHSR